MRRLLVLLLCVLLLMGCSRYPARVRDQLEDPGHYRTCTGTLTAIEAGDVVTLRISFEDTETVRAFLGSEPNAAAMPYIFGFEVVSGNHQLLTDSGFYESILPGDTVTIQASDLIYMDGNYFFLAALSCDGTEYLRFGDGLANISEYLNN